MNIRSSQTHVPQHGPDERSLPDEVRQRSATGAHILLTGNTAFKLANFRAGLIRALVRDGHKLTALVPPDHNAAKLAEMGCHVVPLRMNRKGAAPHQELALIYTFWSAFRRLRPDVVLSFTIKNNIYGAVAARRLGIPFLPNVTGLGTAFSGTGLLNRVVVRLYRRAFRHVPAVFFQNRDDLELFNSLNLVSTAQARVLPGSGVDTDLFAFAPLPDGPPTFLMIARLIHAKGVMEFIAAAEAVRKSNPGTRFQLMGPFDFGNRHPIRKSVIKAASAKGSIDFLGECDDVRPAMAAAHCVVLPSFYREGVPRVLLEAAAMGRPIITTDAIGCREAVSDGLTGFLCRPRDAADLADKMRTLLALGREDMEIMGQRGREKMVKQFDERLVVEAYRGEIARLLNRQGGAPLPSSDL